MVKKINLAGERFGKLTVIDETPLRKFGHVVWKCNCDCGNVTMVASHYLSGGDTKSCGCIPVSKHALKHGKSDTKAYKTWANMLSRCYSEINPRHPIYKAKGIIVCDRWHVFENFYADMGDPPFSTSTIDRIDNSGNYELSNCRWATQRIQGNNRDNNKFITFKGKVQTIGDWIHELGLNRNTVYGRLRRGWEVEAALSAPIGKIR